VNSIADKKALTLKVTSSSEPGCFFWALPLLMGGQGALKMPGKNFPPWLRCDGESAPFTALVGESMHTMERQ
jgi:hypothetical protein